jgi:hypothetical protein
MSRIIRQEFSNYQHTSIDQMENVEPELIKTKWVNKSTLNWINIIKSQMNKNTPDPIKNYNYTVTNNDNTPHPIPFQPLSLLSSDILQMYQINSIDNLLEYIDTNIKSENILTINRVVNCWIYTNYNVLKQHNNVLEKIYKKIIYEYIKNFNIDMERVIDQKNININKEIKEYIDSWVNKKNIGNFSLNLLTDFISYFIKKYKL